MFKINDFRVRKRHDYPYFDKIIQSWYSPILALRKNEDAKYSSCVTIGIARDQIHDKNVLMVISTFNKILPSSVEFLKHVECLSKDYLNKGDVSIASSRSPGVVVFEAEEGKENKIINMMKLDNIFRFYPDFHGGEDLDDRMQAVKPFVGKVLLTSMPNSRELRPDDSELMGRLLAYPSNTSFSIASAYSQAILYAKYAQFLGDEKPFVGGGPKHVFY